MPGDSGVVLSDCDSGLISGSKYLQWKRRSAARDCDSPRIFSRVEGVILGLILASPAGLGVKSARLRVVATLETGRAA